MEVLDFSEDDRNFMHTLVLPSTFILIFLGVIGIYGHVSLIYATLKFKYLQSPCNILIALLALGDLLHQLSHFPYAYVVFSRITFITQRACFWVQLIPFFGMQYSMVVILCLGLDRFYCIISPFGYRGVATTKRTRITYIIAVNLFPVMSSIVVATVGYIQMEERPDNETLCLIAAFIVGEYENLWYIFNLFLAASSVIVYLVNWIIMWKRSNGGNNVRKTLKPMTIILFLTFFGWFSLMVIMMVINSRTGSAIRKTGYASYAGIGVNITISANYFVYKYFSLDYRRAFRELWSRKKSEVSTAHISSR